jgi:hypothetical protein
LVKLAKEREAGLYLQHIIFITLKRIKIIYYIEREGGRKEGLKRVNSPSLGSNISYLSVAITASTNRSVPAMAGFGNFFHYENLYK